MQKLAGIVGLFCLFIVFFQNCGNVRLASLSSESLACQDSAVYQAYLPLNAGDNILRLLKIQDGITERTDYPASWIIDGENTNLLPAPACATRNEFQIQVTYENDCGVATTQTTRLTDPRCAPEPPEEPDPVVPDPPAEPTVTVTIPGTGDEPTSCNPNEQPTPQPAGYTTTVVPPLGPEPAIPSACLALLPGLVSGEVQLPFAPVATEVRTNFEIQSLYNLGTVSRNRDFNNAYSRSCTGNTNEYSLQRSGFGKNQFISMRFRTLNTLDTGVFRVFGHAIGSTNGTAFATISECPGDFGKIVASIGTGTLSPAYPQMRTLLYYGQPALRAYNSVAIGNDNRSVALDRCSAVVVNPDTGFELAWTNDSRHPGCLLEKNKDYYVNIIFRRAGDMMPTCPRQFPLENQFVGSLDQVSNCSFNYQMERSNWYQ